MNVEFDDEDNSELDELELNFLEACKNTNPILKNKIKQIHDLLNELEEISDNSGVPFKYNFFDTEFYYIPRSLKDKLKIDFDRYDCMDDIRNIDDFNNVMLNDPGWSNSFQ